MALGSRSSCTGRWRWVLVLGAAALYALGAYYPFRFQPPRQVRNAAERLADGSLRFPERGMARAEQPPEWLADVIADGAIEIELELRAHEKRQVGPARILTLSSGLGRRNLSIEHDWEALVLRLRRPGSNLDGAPGFQVARLFREPGWHRVRVRIRDRILQVEVDGTTRLERPLPPGALSSWDPDAFMALGNEVVGGRPWRGEIRRAVVRVRDRSVEYTRSEALTLPPSWWVLPHRLDRRVQRGKLLYLSRRDALVNFVGFMPFGALIWWAAVQRRRRIAAAAVASAILSFCMELGQLFIYPRHPALGDLLINVLGGATGAAAAQVGASSLQWARRALR